MLSLSNPRKLRVGLTVLALIVAALFNLTNSLHKRVIGGDAQGYYAWLPTTLLYHQLTFDVWADSLASQTGYTYPPHYLNREGNHLINKYTFGSALLMAPFFGVGHGVAVVSGAATDGFSLPYVLFTSLAGLFFGLAGLWFVYKIARSYEASPALSFLVALALGLGTNLFHYAVMQPAMSHVYSFAAIAAFAWLIRREVTAAPDDSNLWKAALVLGLIVAIRPVNGLVVLAVPFLADGLGQLIAVFRRVFVFRYLWKIVVAGAVFPILLMVVWELQTGYKIFYSYKGEGFLWDSPSISALLFSYRKGWFVYTPMALLMVVGVLAIIVRRESFRAISFISFFVVLIYSLASWWSWWYGDGFGMRPLVDYYALLMIPALMWVRLLKSERIQGSLATLVVLLAAFNLLQTWQYNAGILLPDNMTRQKYWHVFCKTSTLDYAGSIGLQSEDLFGALQRDTLLTLHNDFEKVQYRWSPWTRKMLNDSAFSGSWVLFYDSVQTFSMSIGIDSARLFRDSENLLIEGSFWYLEKDVDAVLRSPLVVDIQTPEGLSRFYKAAALKEVPDPVTGVWRKASFRFTAPKPDSSHILKLYLWNKSNKRFYVDDFEATLYKISY